MKDTYESLVMLSVGIFLGILIGNLIYYKWLDK